MTVKLAPTGVLLVRLWVEGDPATDLRARITRTADIQDGAGVTTIAGTAEEVLATVRDWLEDMTNGSMTNGSTRDDDPAPGPE
jgi:hypothetical protein